MHQGEEDDEGDGGDDSDEDEDTPDAPILPKVTGYKEAIYQYVRPYVPCM